MKKIYSSAALLFTLLALAQPPANYYSNATGTGYVLKTQLFNIIKNHNTISYTPGLWNLYPSTDMRADGKVWDIYTNCNFTFGPVSNGGNQDNGSGGTSECQLYNREHTFPKSWFLNVPPMNSDAFHVMPTDKKVNGLRGNYAYGIVGTAAYTSSNGSKIGNCIAPGYLYSNVVFEPADEFKGDIARTYFYMATCYQNLIGGWQNNDNDGNTVLDGSSDKVFEDWYLNLMKSWNENDPVSAKEIARNNAVYAQQNNRNPFIDHPEWVTTIWGSLLSNDTFDALSSISVYPNPSNDHKINISSEIAISDIQLFTINGQLVQQIKSPLTIQKNYILNNIPQGLYFLQISAENKMVTKKVLIN